MLKPRKRKREKPEPWPHPFGKLDVPDGAVVHDGGWACEPGESEHDYEADARERKQDGKP